jgi:predicted cobalt transporter CbtA
MEHFTSRVRMNKQSITDLPESPEDERRRRMIKYTVAMSVRVVCIVCMLFVRDWWLLLFGIGAVVLPYFAVVLANVSSAPKPGSTKPAGVVAIPGTIPPRDFGGRPE